MFNRDLTILHHLLKFAFARTPILGLKFGPGRFDPDEQLRKTFFLVRLIREFCFSGRPAASFSEGISQ